MGERFNVADFIRADDMVSAADMMVTTLGPRSPPRPRPTTPAVITSLADIVSTADMMVTTISPRSRPGPRPRSRPTTSADVVSPTRARARDGEDKCSVCLDPPTEPRVLRCLHVFCTNCLQGMLDEVGRAELVVFGQQEQLVCPNCRDESDPLASADQYPLDYAAPKAEECCSIRETAANETKEPCKLCGDEDTADVQPAAHCEDCGGGICEDCYKTHHKWKKFKENHNFVSWEEFSVNNSFTMKKQRKMCRDHDLEIQLYCERCSQFVCCLCLKDRHKTHMDSAKPLQEVHEKRLTEVGQVKEAAEKRRAACEKHIEGLDEMEKGLTEYPDSLERSIVSAFDEYMLQLSTWREQKLTEARERYSEMAKTISTQKSDTSDAIDKLNTGINFAKKATGCCNSSDVIQMSGMVINRLKSTMETFDIPPLRRPLVYEKGVLNLGKLRDLEEGDINVKPPDFCFMNSENTIVVNFTLPVHTQPVVKVLYGSQKQRSLALRPNTPGLWSVVDKFKFDFFPRCAGKHTIEVWVGGVMVRRCDNVMVVRGAPERTSKVKPGPDWNGDENITVGTVLNAQQLTELPRVVHALGEAEEADDEIFEVQVSWDNEEVVNYQWGNDDIYELELLV